MHILNSYTGGTETQVEDLDQLDYTEPYSDEFYFGEYMAEKIRVAQNEIDVWKAERWPDLIIGYVKETEIDSDYPHRFKGGITVPIWQGQYKGEILASKAEIEMLQAETALRLKEAMLQKITWKNKMEQAANTIQWFRNTVIPQTDQLLEIYRRLYEGGQTDFTQTMKYIADAADAYREYVEILKIHNQAVIELDYLHRLN
jgi:cobalt-zinc-cadmium resistance protein CzcA